MKMISLTKGLFAIVDNEDFEHLTRWKWRAQRARAGSNKFYAVRGGPTVNGKRTVIWMHNEIMQSRARLDHIDRNGLNNQRANLRRATHQQNCLNMFSEAANRSGFKGVSWKATHGQWCAQIRANGKVRHIGLFDQKEAAAAAYDLAAKAHFGEFALTNSALGKLHA